MNVRNDVRIRFFRFLLDAACWIVILVVRDFILLDDSRMTGGITSYVIGIYYSIVSKVLSRAGESTSEVAGICKRLVKVDKRDEPFIVRILCLG